MIEKMNSYQSWEKQGELRTRPVQSVICLLLSVLSIGAIFYEPTEIQLHQAFNDYTHGKPIQALHGIEHLIATYPNFLPAYILRGEMLLGQSGIPSIIHVIQNHDALRIRDLMDELRVRLSYQSPAKLNSLIPSQIVSLSPKVEYILFFDIKFSRLYLLQHQHAKPPEVIADLYASAGREGMGKIAEGDLKTPAGVYYTNGYIEANKLPQLYGAGAFTLSYPSPFDTLKGKTGAGIWLHGIPAIAYSRPPLSSRGCVVISNDALHKIRKLTEGSTIPFILGEHQNWIEKEVWRKRKPSFVQLIHEWRLAWESLDVEHHLAFYSPQYTDKSGNHATMVQRTRKNAIKKKHVDLEISNLDIFLDPQKQELSTFFLQKYHSNNYSITYRKHQVWKHSPNGWKIIYEGRAS